MLMASKKYLKKPKPLYRSPTEQILMIIYSGSLRPIIDSFTAQFCTNIVKF
jgi:hypothetical protein